MNIQFFHAVFFQGSSGFIDRRCSWNFRHPEKSLENPPTNNASGESGRPDSPFQKIYSRVCSHLEKRVWCITSIWGAENFNPPKEGFLMFPLLYLLQSKHGVGSEFSKPTHRLIGLVWWYLWIWSSIKKKHDTVCFQWNPMTKIIQLEALASIGLKDETNTPGTQRNFLTDWCSHQLEDRRHQHIEPSHWCNDWAPKRRFPLLLVNMW